MACWWLHVFVTGSVCVCDGVCVCDWLAVRLAAWLCVADYLPGSPAAHFCFIVIRILILNYL
jgi:hypothetical protein